MYVTPGVCFLAGLGVGVLVTIVAIVGIALYLDNKDKEK